MRSRGLLPIGWLASWGALACGEAPPALAPSPDAPAVAQASQPDVVVAVASGLRADATEALLEGLAMVPSHRFLAAYSQSPSTFTSLGSLLAGMYPSALPMCAPPYRGRRDPDAALPWCAHIPDGRHTLPEVLGLYGYHSALLARDVLLHEDNLKAGFSAYLEPQPGVAGAWWAATPAPRLLVVVDGSLMLQRRNDLAARLQDASVHQIQATYQTEVRGLGQRWRTLLASLPSPRRQVVLAGLHGQNLGESTGDPTLPDNPLFSDIILERTIHVPLMFLAPSPFSETASAGEAVYADPVELVDVLPTILSWTSAVPPAGLSGGALPASAGATQGYAYAELGDMLALHTGTEMLTFRGMIHHASALDPRLDASLRSPAGHLHLHNIQADPLQTTEQIMTQPERAAALLALLQDMRAHAAAPPPEALTPARIQALHQTSSEGYW